MNTPEREEFEVDLIQVIKGVWSQKRLLAAAMLAMCVLGLLWGFISREAPQQEWRVAYVQFYVGNNSDIRREDYINATEAQMASYITSTYNAVLKSPTTLQMIIDEGDLPYTIQELSPNITTSTSNSTRIYRVNAYSYDPEEAMDIASIIAEVLPRRMEQVVPGSVTRLIDPPTLREEKAKKTETLKPILRLGAIAAAGGLILAAGFVAVKEAINGEIYDGAYLRRNFSGVPLLGSVPDLTKTGGSYDSKHRKGAGR